MTITPDHGPVHGGTQVAIRGNLHGVKRITFSNTPATDIKVIHDTLVTCRTPEGLRGLAAVGAYAGTYLMDTAVFEYVEQ